MYLKNKRLGKLITKLRNWMRKLWRVEYRLSVYYRCKIVHFYGSTVEEVLLQADLSMPKQWRQKGAWSLYRTGPLYLAEREIDSNDW